MTTNSNGDDKATTTNPVVFFDIALGGKNNVNEWLLIDFVSNIHIHIHIHIHTPHLIP